MSNEIEIINIRQKQLRDKDRGFFRVKEVSFRVGATNHTLDVSMSDFNADKTRELVLAEAEKIKAPLGRQK